MQIDNKIIDAFNRIYEFNHETSLTSEIASMEKRLSLKNSNDLQTILESKRLGLDFIQSASIVKKAISQIDVLIHAYGILNLLPSILEQDEIIEYLSLGAGNTGKSFDLETNKRIAEFKFINWSGSSDTIRQNTTFKDFFSLVEYQTDKQRFLYLLNKDIVLKFLSNNRAIKSVLSRNIKGYEKFIHLHGNKYTTVSEYYHDKKHLIEIIDINDIFPGFIL